MNIVYACDDKYAEPAGISMLSLFENNKEEKELCVFIIDSDISLLNKEKLEFLARSFARNLNFIPLLDIEKKIGIPIDAGRYTHASLGRIFLTSMLPIDVNRVIYLDCDTMVRQSLRSLWTENLGGNVIGGIYDTLPVYHKMRIGLDKADIYVNSGVLLMDLRLWIERDIQNKIVNIIKVFGGKLALADQDIINVACRGAICALHPRYNGYWSKEMQKYIKANQSSLEYYTGIRPYYDNTMLLEAKNDPIIAHFIGYAKSRPWIRGSEHVLNDEYMRYRNISPWADAPLKEAAKQTMTRKLKNTIIQIAPHWAYRSYRRMYEFLSFRLYLTSQKK